MSIRGTKTANEIYNAIREEWNKNEWDWDTHTGQATKRLLPIVSAMMARELAELKIVVEALTDNINTTGLVSERAKDAVMLYNALKRSGMEKEDLTATVCAFLEGEKFIEQKHYAMQDNMVGGAND